MFRAGFDAGDRRGPATPAAAQQPHTHGSAASKPAARLFEGLGQYHRPIATSNPDAQRYFDQGLTLVYGFNHEEAIRSFEEAARLDPAAAMPHWGIALALGENINSPVDPDRAARAYAAVQKARELAKATAARQRPIKRRPTRPLPTPPRWKRPTSTRSPRATARIRKPIRSRSRSPTPRR